MNYEWDESKCDLNRLKHGVDFSAVLDFQWDQAVETEDTRKVYDEPRWIALGRIGDRLHVLIDTIRFDNIRVISLRKVNDRKIQYYEKTWKQP